MKKQKILILGGTQFIGRNIVERLNSMDDVELYLFNRQRTGAELFPDVNKLKGDRQTDDIKQIQGKKWDYVIDVSCYFPADLERVISCINYDLKNYIFISTCSVYNTGLPLLARDETTPILACTETEATDTSNATYGQRKAACEAILQSSTLNHSILRPALVFGQYDHTDRLYYWLYQVHKCDRLLIPNLGGSLFSVSYIHDLVNAVVTLIHNPSLNGTYNVTSKIQFSITQLVSAAEEIMDKRVKKINASSGFLKEQNIQEWIDMPLWIDNDYFTFDNSLIKSKLGINFTPIKDAVSETINYYDSLGWLPPKYGLSEKVKNTLIDKLQVN